MSGVERISAALLVDIAALLDTPVEWFFLIVLAITHWLLHPHQWHTAQQRGSNVDWSNSGPA